jgi:hypothetical protein
MIDRSENQKFAQQQAEDIKILQKVNAVHRTVFAEKYPAQVEHCLRLVSERLQAGLDKRAGCDITDPSTWRMSTQEIADLTDAMSKLHAVRQSMQE